MAVTRGQKLAEWDPFTLPIITERATARWSSPT
jgi:DNA-directed RNA polymerase subunit beta'